MKIKDKSKIVIGYCRYCGVKLKYVWAKYCSSNCWNKDHPNEMKEAQRKFKKGDEK